MKVSHKKLTKSQNTVFFPILNPVTENRLRDGKGGKCRVIVNGYEVPSSGDKNVLKLDYGDGITTLNILKLIKLHSLNG